MNENYAILVVEDDENDYFMLERAFRKNGITNPIYRASDGLVAVQYLQGQGEYGDRSKHPLPEVLIVDLKMPRMSGLELLAWIRDHPEHRIIPTVIMSSSEQRNDVAVAYQLGANTYFVKPSDFETLITLTKSIHDYWMRGTKPKL